MLSITRWPFYSDDVMTNRETNDLRVVGRVAGRGTAARGMLPALFVFAAALLAGGCSGPSMQNGDLTQVQIHSDRPRAGNVYLMRGFIGIWSTGIDALGVSINQAGVRAHVYRNEQARELTEAVMEKYKGQKVYEPLIIIGHSWGADNAIELARKLDAENIKIDLIITLDPVTPPKVPKNVKWVYNVYQTNGMWDTLPFFRGVALNKEDDNPNPVQNVNIREQRTDLLEPNTDHYNIEKNTKIHKDVMAQILKVCPTRDAWTRMHPDFKPPKSALPSPQAAPQYGSHVRGAATPTASANGSAGSTAVKAGGVIKP